MYSKDIDIFTIQYVYSIQLTSLFEGQHWETWEFVYFVSKKKGSLSD